MNEHYSVYPRYTPGSPAVVDRVIAEQVAKEEIEAYARTLTGVYGVAQRERAESLGCAGIVELVSERSGKLYFYDLITEESGVKQHRTQGH